MKACFMGLGYIGLPTAIIAAKHGVQVTGVDINPKVVELTNQGKLHIIEPGMEEMLQEVVKNGTLHASTKPETSDAYFMVVPTPFKGNHEPDISYVEAATRAVLPFLKEGDLYVIESTSPVGTTDKMRDLIFAERPELEGKIYIAYCPERVLPGNVIYELVHNDRVIGGMNEESTTKAIEFYSQFVQGTLHRTNCKTAEMCKLTENSSRDVQIAFANELSLICDKAGINVWELIRLANWKIQCKLPPKTKRFCPLKTFNNAPLKSLDRWGYYYFSLFPSVCSHFTDTFSCQLNPVRRMYNTIHNGICYCRVSDCIIPIVRWQLRGDDDGLAPMSVLYYIEQDGSFLGIKVHKEEVIQYEQRAPFDSLEFRFQCAFYFCHLKRTHKFRSIRIICPYALLAGFIPHCCGKEALPGTG